jgi:hypothetical protein
MMVASAVVVMLDLPELNVSRSGLFPDVPAMACHKSGGPPARSVATLGDGSHHPRVDRSHLWCPTKSSKGRAGCDVVTVQRALGHASANTTLATYSHLWPDADDRTRTAAEHLMAAALQDRAD